MIATSKLTVMPTEPALRRRGGSGLHAIGEEGTKRSRYLANRSPLCRAWASIAWCIVGTAEYQVGRNAVSHAGKLLTSNPEVHTTLAPAASDATNVACRPCP